MHRATKRFGLSIIGVRRNPSELPAQDRARRGVFFVVTFVTSIPAWLLYGPLLDHADYILGPGADTRIGVGAFLEVLLAIANIGTAVTLFPVLKRQNEAVSTLPEILWEASLGIWLIVKGFKPSTREVRVEVRPATSPA